MECADAQQPESMWRRKTVRYRTYHHHCNLIHWLFRISKNKLIQEKVDIFKKIIMTNRVYQVSKKILQSTIVGLLAASTIASQ